MGRVAMKLQLQSEDVCRRLFHEGRVLLQVSHLPGGAVSCLRRREKRLHRDQVYVAASSGGRRQSGDARGLHHRGEGLLHDEEQVVLRYIILKSIDSKKGI